MNELQVIWSTIQGLDDLHAGIEGKNIKECALVKFNT